MHLVQMDNSTPVGTCGLAAVSVYCSVSVTLPVFLHSDTIASGGAVSLPF